MCKLIAPDESKELAQVLAGVKPFAVVEQTKVTAAYWQEVLSYARVLDVRVPREQTLAFCLKSNSHLHTTFNNLITPRAADVIRTREQYQRCMGRLFGYSDEEIEAFVQNPPDCNCWLCGGHFKE